MIRTNLSKRLVPSLVFTGLLSIGTAALADDPPPAPANGGGRHHNPAWAACKQKADDQKIAAGDARRDFMKNCIKSSKTDAPAP